ncbi:MAG: glycosyltransferase [Bacilli bacterium]|jgi:glycosyltransferase involved in cell wall biosynthesis
MRIIYCSQAMKDSDFNNFVKNANWDINPSNQNFHLRLIRALASQGPITAVTLRPFSIGLFDERLLSEAISKDEDIIFKYSSDKATRFYQLFQRGLSLRKQISREIKDSKEEVVFVVDALKYSLAKAAIKVALKYRIKIFAVITDNPRLLSGVSKTYIKTVESLFRHYDGFLTLTLKLNDYANRFKKPNYTFAGLAESTSPSKIKITKPYFFFGGALYERYGVMNLINAFKKVKTDYQLLIAGHGPLIEAIEVMAKEDSRIRYLGLLSKEDLISYQCSAVCNINPRPFDQKLDDYSVPSKVLEYLSVGVPLISTMNGALHKQFCGEAIWIKDGGEDELRKAMELFLLFNPEDIKKKALLAKEKVLSIYGLEIQGRAIYDFIAVNNSSSSN